MTTKYEPKPSNRHGDRNREQRKNPNIRVAVRVMSGNWHRPSGHLVLGFLRAKFPILKSDYKRYLFNKYAKTTM
jgi:hypothetical protein